jgi:uncharacterized membrane protein YkvA (DUF1232 family)
MYDQTQMRQGGAKALKLRGWARAVKRDVHAICLAARDPRVPWHAKALAIGVAVYALSPADLIPDFIPVLGYQDDLMVLSLGTLAVVQLIPPEILAEHRATAAMALEKADKQDG